MATLAGSTIADTYDQLLALPTDGGNTTNLVALTDGNADTTFALSLATTSIAIKAADKMIFDSNSHLHTYIQESAADILDFYAGGTHMLSLDKTNLEVVINEDQAAVDFRVESASSINLLVCDASTARVGIGVTAPDKLLHVAGEAYIDSYLSLRTTDDQANKWVLYTDTDDSFRVNYNGAGDAEVVILNSGRVGIGTTNPGFMLDLVDARPGDYALYVNNSGDDATTYCARFVGGAHDGSGLTYYVRADDGNGQEVGYLQHAADGDFEAVDASDIRLKENVVDTAVKCLESINAIKVRDFNWKTKGKAFKSAGLIANELREVFPSAVSGEPDAMESYDAEYDEDGNVTKEAGERIVPMMISKVKLVPVLIKAVQELSAKVEALENNNEQGDSSNEQEEPDSGGDASSESSGQDSGGAEADSSDSSDAASGTSEASESSSDDGNESSGGSGSDSSDDSEGGSGGDDSEGSEGDGEPSDGWTKDQLKVYMDSNEIAYNSGDTKQDLLDKIILAGESPDED